ncbi:flocculation protein FLO11-like [Anopheles merus]|uniref:flocculation protein FLO11-like n=1 Tax=Anopheles merus TaxID=30066 RepID=UPI001BE4B2B5|nr:flocculation protein FLO11-like [Anopheles merus]
MQIFAVFVFYMMLKVDFICGIPLLYERTNVVNKVEFSDLGIDGDRIDPLIDVSEEEQQLRNVSVSSHTEINSAENPDSNERTNTTERTQPVAKVTVIPSNDLPNVDDTVTSHFTDALTPIVDVTPNAEQTATTQATTAASDNINLRSETSTVQPETTSLVQATEKLPSQSTTNDETNKNAESVHEEKSISTNLIDSTDMYVITTTLPTEEDRSLLAEGITLTSFTATAVPAITITEYIDASGLKKSSTVDVETLSTTLMTPSEHTSTEMGLESSTSITSDIETTTTLEYLASTEDSFDASIQTTETIIEATTSTREDFESSVFISEHPEPTSWSNVPVTGIEHSITDDTPILPFTTTAANSETTTTTEPFTTDRTDLQETTIVSTVDANEVNAIVTEMPASMEVSTIEHILSDTSTSSSDIENRETMTTILPATENVDNTKTTVEIDTTVTQTTTQSIPTTVSQEELEISTQTVIENEPTTTPSSTETNAPLVSNSEGLTTSSAEQVTELVNVTEETNFSLVASSEAPSTTSAEQTTEVVNGSEETNFAVVSNSEAPSTSSAEQITEIKNVTKEKNFPTQTYSEGLTTSSIEQVTEAVNVTEETNFPTLTNSESLTNSSAEEATEVINVTEETNFPVSTNSEALDTTSAEEKTEVINITEKTNFPTPANSEALSTSSAEKVTEALNVTEETNVRLNSEELSTTSAEQVTEAVNVIEETNFPLNSEVLSTISAEQVTEAVTEQILVTDPNRDDFTGDTTQTTPSESIELSTLYTLEEITDTTTMMNEQTEKVTSVETEAYHTTTDKGVAQNALQHELTVPGATILPTEGEDREELTTGSVERFSITEKNNAAFVTTVVESSFEMTTKAPAVVTVTEPQSVTPETNTNTIFEENREVTPTDSFSFSENRQYSQDDAISSTTTELSNGLEVSSGETEDTTVTVADSTIEIAQPAAETPTTSSVVDSSREQIDADTTITSTTFSAEEVSSIAAESLEVAAPTDLATIEMMSKEATEAPISSSTTDSSLALTVLALVTAPSTMLTTAVHSSATETQVLATTPRPLVPQESVIHEVTDEANLPAITDDDSISSTSAIPPGLDQESPAVALTTPDVDSGSCEQWAHAWSHTLILLPPVTLLFFIL